MEINQLIQRLKHGEQYTVMVNDEPVQQLQAPSKYTRKAAEVITALYSDNQRLVQDKVQLGNLLVAAHADCETLRKPTKDTDYDETRL